MKINVVKDKHGKVIATYENAVAGGPSIKPVLQPGHTVQEVEAEKNYTADIKAIYERHSQTDKNRQS